jgi:O-antigen ligase
MVKENTLKTKYPFIIFTSVNVLLLFMIISKGVVLGLFLSVFIDLVMNFRKSKIIIILLICIAICLLASNRRVKEVFEAEMYSEVNENFSTSIRVGIYKCAVKVIGEEFILGYGIGDAQRALNICYSNHSNILLKNRYNSHNQYFDVLLKTGFLGLLIFFYFLYTNFRKAFKSENELIIYLLIFYCVLFLTENILVRQSGVILFFFLLSFLNLTSKTSSIQPNPNKKRLTNLNLT